MKSIIGIVALVVAVVIVGIIAIDGWAVVNPGHRGVYVTMGSVYPEPLAEGFYWKKPMMSRIDNICVQQQTERNSTSCFTSDLQQVTVEYAVMYRIPENRVVELYRNYKGEIGKALIYPRVEEGLKQLTASYRAENIVTNREKIKAELASKVKLAIGDIVTINDLAITNIDFTDELEKAIELKVVREQEALAKKYELEKATKDAEITMVQARAEAESVKIKGEALKDAPSVVELELIKKWDGHAPSTVVTGKGGASIVLPVTKEKE